MQVQLLRLIQRDGKRYRGISGDDLIEVPDSVKTLYDALCHKGTDNKPLSPNTLAECGEAKALARMIQDGYQLTKESLEGARSIAIQVRGSVDKPGHGDIWLPCDNNCNPTLSTLGITWVPVP